MHYLNLKNTVHEEEKYWLQNQRNVLMCTSIPCTLRDVKEVLACTYVASPSFLPTKLVRCVEHDMELMNREWEIQIEAQIWQSGFLRYHHIYFSDPANNISLNLLPAKLVRCEEHDMELMNQEWEIQIEAQI